MHQSENKKKCVVFQFFGNCELTKSIYTFNTTVYFLQDTCILCEQHNFQLSHENNLALKAGHEKVFINRIKFRYFTYSSSSVFLFFDYI